MKQRTNLILIAVVLVLLIITGICLFNSTRLKAEPTSKVIQNDQNSYCELDTEANTCLPASSCEFQTDSEGHKICLGKFK